MSEHLRRFTKSIIWGFSYALQYRRVLTRETGSPGRFLVTFDVETACDYVHWMDWKSAVNRAYKNRKTIEKIIADLRTYKFPLTWLCTGHSLLESCSGHQPRIYPWATSKNGFAEGYDRKDWFSRDPCDSYRSHPEWYFGDLFNKIVRLNTGHEIGSHGFGHLRADLASKKEFCEDMAELSAVFKKQKLKFASHAFPWNKAGFLLELKSFGVKCCRLKEGYFGSTIKKPTINDLVFVYQSFEGRPACFEVLEFGMEIAGKLGLLFVWLLHPEEISEERNFSIFARICERALSLADKRKLLIQTMKEIR